MMPSPTPTAWGWRRWGAWIESEGEEEAQRRELLPLTDLNGTSTGLHLENLILDTHELVRNGPNDKWRIVVEARDSAGLATRYEVGQLGIGNAVWRVRGQPGNDPAGRTSEGGI